MSKPVVIFGTGGMGKLLHSFIYHSHEVAAFAGDDEFVPDGASILGAPAVKRSALLWKYPPKKYAIIMGCGFHQMNQLREDRFLEFTLQGYEVYGYRHHLIAPHTHVDLHHGSVIYDGVAIHSGTLVDINAFISSNVSIGHDCIIGAHSWINSGVTLGGGVTVGRRCVLGMNAVVAQGVKLGEATFVGANTLVTHDTPPNSVIVSPHGEMVAVDSERFLHMTGQP